MSKKLFRPPPQNNDYDSEDDDSDDDDEGEDLVDDDDDDEDPAAAGGGDQPPPPPVKPQQQPPPAAAAAAAASNSKKAASASANLSDDDDDDDDDDDSDDDDEDDEEEDEKQKRAKKRKGSSGGGGGEKKRSKPAASAFFDVEAEASDDDDEDEDEKGGRSSSRKKGGGAAGADEQMDAETRELIRQQDRRRAQVGGRFGGTMESLARDIEDRHRNMLQQQQQRTIMRPAPVLGGTGAAARRPLAPATGAAAAGGAGRPRPGASGGVGAAGSERMPPPLAVTASHQQDVMEDDVDDDMMEGGAEVYTAVTQQSLVPSVSDPSFWMVSCPTGKEQEYVFQIMNKCIAFARQGKPLGITGAIAAQSKGKIYIESFSEPAVMEAINLVRGLLAYTMRLVPIGDMTTVMTVTSKKKPVKKGEWVRMTRGHYKGDLALVKDVKESGLRCIVQSVPRLDLTLSDLSPEQARVRRKTVRPPQKFFSSQEIAAMGKHSLGRQRFPGLDVYCDFFEGNYYHDGYLLKEMTVGSMVKPCTDEDPPTLDELQRFQRRQKSGNDPNNDEEENEGSKMAASLLDELSALQGKTGLGKSSASGLLIGDTIEVIEGDLIGLRGKLTSLDATTVKVKPTGTNVDLGGMEEVEFLASQVRKYIAVGAHVKVTDGRYANETGVVVAVEQLDGETDFTAVLLTDVTNKEVSVRLSQLRESAEVASGQDKLQGYELYDLVVLSGGGSANEVGVIVRVGREDFTVVNNHGIAREVRPEELRGKRNSMSTRAVALDVQGNQIRCGDTVNVAEGPHKGKTATIKRMSRSQLFLHSQTRSEHAGVFVVRSRSCVLAGTKGQNRGGGMDGGVSPFATPQSHTGRGPPGGGRKKDDGLIGKTVRIQAGAWKGYLGTVADTTATHVQVELHSRLKKVMVTHERVHVVGDKFGATEDRSQTDVVVNTSTLAPTTPFIAAGQTPMHGGATPMHGGGLENEGNDEVWRPGGTIDQDSSNAVSKDDDGWGSTSNNSNTQFGEDNGGWGSSAGGQAAGSSWGAPPQPKVEAPDNSAGQQGGFSSNGGASAAAAVIKREPLKSEMETDMADAEERPVWFMERVSVLIKSSQQQGVIKEIKGDNSALIELEDKSTQTVAVSDLAMVPPSEHDTVLVTGGNEVGLEGTLVCIDGTDGILKDANDDFKIVEVSFLARVQC